MSHGMLSREELYKFYGYDLAADINTQSAVAEFLDVSHFQVDDIDDAFPELTAPASSEEPSVAGVPECPPTLVPSRCAVHYPLISVPPSWCVSPMEISPPTGQSTPVLPSPSLPDPPSSQSTSVLPSPSLPDPPSSQSTPVLPSPSLPDPPSSQSTPVLPSPSLPDPPSSQSAPSTPSTPRGTKRELSPPTPEPAINKRARGRQAPISPDGKTVAGPSGAGKDRPFVCPVDECKRAFTRKEHLDRHTVCLHTNSTGWTCTYDPKCTRTFPRRDNYKRHVKKDHPGAVWETPL